MVRSQDSSTDAQTWLVGRVGPRLPPTPRLDGLSLGTPRPRGLCCCPLEPLSRRLLGSPLRGCRAPRNMPVGRRGESGETGPPGVQGGHQQPAKVPTPCAAGAQEEPVPDDGAPHASTLCTWSRWPWRLGGGFEICSSAGTAHGAFATLCAARREAPAPEAAEGGDSLGSGGPGRQRGCPGAPCPHAPGAGSCTRPPGRPGRRERVLGSGFKARPRRERGTERGGWRAGGLVCLPVAGVHGPGRVPVWEAHKEKWSLEFSL